jgi:hypothetical protein
VVGPEVAVNGAGDAIVVWNREQGEVCAEAPDNPACVHIIETISRPPGSGSWQPPAEVSRPGVGSGPLVALDPAGNAVVVWSHDIGEPRVLQAAYRRGRSGEWQNPIDLSDERFRAGTQQIGMDAAGNTVVAWARFGQSGSVVQAAVRPVESGVWGPPLDVSPAGAGIAGGPSLAVSAGGDAVVAWVLSTGVVQATVRAPAAGFWQAPVDLSGVGAAPDVHLAIGPAGDTVAVWSSRRAGGAVVQAAFRAAGSGWGPATDVAVTGRADSAAPRAVLDPAGNAHAVWLSGGDRAVAHASVRSRASGAWSQPVELSSRDRDAFDPRLTVDPAGNAVAVWTEGADGLTRAAIRPALGSWQPAVGLSRSDARTRTPRVAMGTLGTALAVWSRLEPRRIRVEASELEGGGPVLANLAVPATGTAGVAVTLNVQPLPWAAPVAGQPTWRFGDGGSASGVTVRHVFARPGRYGVSVTQADTAGGTSTATTAITIGARPLAITVRPTIRGRPRAGGTLTCHAGSWRGTPPIRFAYRWLRNGRAIPSVTTRRYRVRPRDRGTLVMCRVTATNTAGRRSALSRPVRIERR